MSPLFFTMVDVDYANQVPGSSSTFALILYQHTRIQRA